MFDYIRTLSQLTSIYSSQFPLDCGYGEYDKLLPHMCYLEEITRPHIRSVPDYLLSIVEPFCSLLKHLNSRTSLKYLCMDCTLKSADLEGMNQLMPLVQIISH